MRNFRKLEVWQQSMQLVKLVYDIVDCFPKNEMYGLSQQVRRCSVSIPSNVAEGCSRKSDKEFSRYIQIALGSSFELETQLLIALSRKYFTNSEVFDNLKIIQERLNALNNRLNTST